MARLCRKGWITITGPSLALALGLLATSCTATLPLPPPPPPPPPAARVETTYPQDVPIMHRAVEDTLRRMDFIILESIVEPNGAVVRSFKRGYPLVVVRVFPDDWGSRVRVEINDPAGRDLANEIQTQIPRNL